MQNWSFLRTERFNAAECLRARRVAVCKTDSFIIWIFSGVRTLLGLQGASALVLSCSSKVFDPEKYNFLIRNRVAPAQLEMISEIS